ncbi:CCC motif membrane protein [Maribacter sp. 2-571]|uniref:CCC motif membrane protein n=1 Tax=Maribacter sp. 2-571 TaxID=3417569 RepID=UPI003D34DA0F
MNQETLPGASNALIFGILSVVLVFVCCGPFAAIFSFIGLSNAKKAERIYQLEPHRYMGYSDVKTGRVLSYIGLALSLIGIIFIILYFGVIVALVAAEGGF